MATRVNEEEKKIKAVKTGSEEDFVNWNSCYAWTSINNMHGGYSYQILSSNWNWKISRVLWMADTPISIDILLISKENVVLRRWECETWQFGFIKRVDEGRIATVRGLESWRFERLPFDFLSTILHEALKHLDEDQGKSESTRTEWKRHVLQLVLVQGDVLEKIMEEKSFIIEMK